MPSEPVRLVDTRGFAAVMGRVHPVGMLRSARIGLAAAVLALLLASVATGTAWARVGEAQRKPTLAGLAKSLVRDGAPGALVVLRTPKRVRRAAAGLSSRDPRVGLRATARFRIASVTKPFVATVVLELVGEGRLGLDDSVERWRPGLVPNGGNITIRELLNHTSGIYNYTDDPVFDQVQIADPLHIWSPRQLVAAATSHPALFAPGYGWAYSNTNYVILGLVVESVTGAPLEQQLRSRLFDPLALRSTAYVPQVDTSGSLAHGFIGSATFPDLPAGTLIDVTPALNGSWYWGAAAIVSNGDDVTKFFASLLGGHILPANLLATMKTVAPNSPDGFRYGLGLTRVRTSCGTAYGHVGDFTAQRNVALATANGKRVVEVMVNVDETDVSWNELEGDAEVALCFT
jgi:D-alanyl-D-alanine carboxypeptidase